MRAKREEFLSAIEGKISSAEMLLKSPEELKNKLSEIKDYLESDWTSIFSTLSEFPLSKDEKKTLKSLIERFHMLERRVNSKLEIFNDFQKYIQVSLEK